MAKLLSKQLLFRIALYTGALVISIGIIFWWWQSNKNVASIIREANAEVTTYDAWFKVAKNFGAIKQSLNEAKQKYPEIDLKNEEASLLELRQGIIDRDFIQALAIYQKLKADFAAKVLVAESARVDEAKKGDLVGTVSYSNSAVSGATIKFFKDGVEMLSIQPTDGAYIFHNSAGKYTIKVTAPGYSDFEQEVEIAAGQKTTFDIVLKKPSAASTSTNASLQETVSSLAPASESQAGFTYERKTVETDRGNFTVNLMSIDLNAGIEVVVDTAADGDCTTDCPVKPLSEYVSANGGFAGIHGTYFCPASYSTCQSEINSFYYKLYNRRLDKRINWTNGLGDYLAFLMIDKSGKASYYNSWYDIKDNEMSTGISCRPNLVSGGQIVVTDADLDSDKERYSKITHGFIGLKGQTIFAGIVSGANILDSASVVKALGIEYALNIDGGGTSAMYVNGSYKVGPGRDMPNAIVFRRK